MRAGPVVRVGRRRRVKTGTRRSFRAKPGEVADPAWGSGSAVVPYGSADRRVQRGGGTFGKQGAKAGHAVRGVQVRCLHNRPRGRRGSRTGRVRMVKSRRLWQRDSRHP
ncbi:hypothetical protein SHIRM173S_03298 [Streptomyces hirsutus]